MVDNVSQGAVTTYMFDGINASHTISATFEQTPEIIANNVVSLYHFNNLYTDDTNNGTAYSTGTFVTGKFSAGISTNNGTSLTTIPNWGAKLMNGDWTLDWWMYRPDSYSGADYHFILGDVGASAAEVSVLTITDNTRLFISQAGQHDLFLPYYSDYGIGLNEWFHIALVKQGNTFYNFLNGTLVGSVVYEYTFNTTYIISPLNSGNYYNYFDEVCFRKGAVWTASFTPPTVPYTLGTVLQGTYTITASAGTGGSISPSGETTVDLCGTQTYTITPNTQYQISDVIVDNVSQGAISSYSFTDITSNHTISVAFIQVEFSIVASAGTGGSISPNGSVSVTSGSSQTFTITPDTGYNITQIIVDGTNKGAISTFTFTNVSSEHTISAMFGTSSDFRTLLLRRR